MGTTVPIRITPSHVVIAVGVIVSVRVVITSVGTALGPLTLVEGEVCASCVVVGHK